MGGGLYPTGGVHDHNRIYFLIQVDGSITWGGGAYKWQFIVMKITE